MRENRRLSIRAILLAGLATLVGAPARPTEPPHRRRPRLPIESPAAGTAPALPSIDGPGPARNDGLEAAPVPNTNILPPAADSTPRTELDIGVPTPPSPYEGSTFSGNDPNPTRAQESSRATSRLPSPGATVRIPVE